jgi:hypothetical protein
MPKHSAPGRLLRQPHLRRPKLPWGQRRPPMHDVADALPAEADATGGTSSQVPLPLQRASLSTLGYLAETRLRPAGVHPRFQAVPMGPRRTTAAAWEVAAVFCLMLGLALALFHTAWAAPFSAQVGGVGDADEYDWFLSWLPFALGHAHDPLISHFVNFPSGINLMWNTSVILPSLLVSPITVIFGATFSYNVLVTLGPALSGAIAYLAFRRWVGEAPALVGALIFGFSPYMVSQSTGHLAQTLLWSAPLLLILSDRILITQRGRPWLDGAALGLLGWAQLLTGEEILAIEAVVGVAALAVLAALGYRQIASHLPYALRAAAVGAVVFVVLSAPFLAVQFLGPYRVQSPHPTYAYVSDLLNFVVPTNITKFATKAALHTSARFSGNGSEQGAYLGIPFLSLVLIALLVARRRQLTWVSLAGFLAAAALSLGPTLHICGRVTNIVMPYDLLQHVGPLKNILPDRFASVMTLFAGLLVALGLQELSRLGKPAMAAGWAIGALGIVALLPITNFPASLDPLFSAYTDGLACPGASNNPAHPPVALLMPASDELDLRWQSEANFCFAMPSDTGMTGTNPGDVGQQNVMLTAGTPGTALPPLTPEVREEASIFLQDLDVQEIVVVPESPASPPWSPTGQAALVNWVTGLTGEQPTQSDDPFRSYIWEHLPTPADIASGNVGKAAASS